MTFRLVRRLALAAAVVAAPALTLWPAVAGAERGLPARATASPAADHARVIVKFRADGALAREAAAAAGAAGMQRPQHAARLSQRMGLSLRDGMAIAPRVQVLMARGLSSAQLVERLARDPDVEYAEIDQRVRLRAAPNDPLYLAGPALNPNNFTGGPEVGQWYLRPSSNVFRSAINAEQAWNLTNGSPTVVVAVLDTGVRLDHPDLSGKLLPGYDFVGDDFDAPGTFTTANDGNGWDADPSDPGDWVTAAEDSTGTLAGCGVSPSSWHGTQVSGLIGAATDNGVGMAGSGRNVRVLPVRVLGKCGGYQSDITAGMYWAAGIDNNALAAQNVPANANRARVVNMSLGSSATCSRTYQDAVTALTNAGVAVVVAAGNEEGLAVDQPANCVGAISVAGIRHFGTKVGYSSVGPENMIAAPAGNCVLEGATDPCLYPLLTTMNTGLTTPARNTYSDSYDASYGTSFATPLVSGTLALMFSARPTLRLADAKAALQATAMPFPASGAAPGTPVCRAPDSTRQLECYCTTSTCGAGMLDALAAVARVSGWVVDFAAPAHVIVGATTSFDGAATTLPSGRSVVAAQWTLTPGSTGAQFVGSDTSLQTQVVTTGVGSFDLTLEVTDNLGVRTRITRAVPVLVEAPVSTSGGGGGGAMGWPWLLALAAAVAALSAARPASARRRP